MQRILVVFQRNNERTVIVDTLTRLGFVDEATSTLEAVRLTDRNIYNLVLAQRADMFGEMFLDRLHVAGKRLNNVLLVGPATCPGEIFAERAAVTAFGAG